MPRLGQLLNIESEFQLEFFFFFFFFLRPLSIFSSNCDTFSLISTISWERENVRESVHPPRAMRIARSAVMILSFIIDSFRILRCHLLQDHHHFQNFYLLLYHYIHSWYIHLLHLDNDTFYYIFYRTAQSSFFPLGSPVASHSIHFLNGQQRTLQIYFMIFFIGHKLE